MFLLLQGIKHEMSHSLSPTPLRTVKHLASLTFLLALLRHRTTLICYIRAVYNRIQGVITAIKNASHVVNALLPILSPPSSPPSATPRARRRANRRAPRAARATLHLLASRDGRAALHALAAGFRAGGAGTNYDMADVMRALAGRDGMCVVSNVVTTAMREAMRPCRVAGENNARAWHEVMVEGVLSDRGQLLIVRIVRVLAREMGGGGGGGGGGNGGLGFGIERLAILAIRDRGFVREVLKTVVGEGVRAYVAAGVGGGTERRSVWKGILTRGIADLKRAVLERGSGGAQTGWVVF